MTSPDPISVFPIPVLETNYTYVIVPGGADKTCIVVDPGDAVPVIDFIDKGGYIPEWIVNTHRHGDHTAGNAALAARYGCAVAAPEECGPSDHVLRGGEMAALCGIEWRIMHTPGHTAGHVCLYAEAGRILLSGDILFASGCGRVFEGTAEEMFQSLRMLADLPPETHVYFGHEYTAANARFAAEWFPANTDIIARLETVQSMGRTTPTTIGIERRCNPFLLCRTVDEFTACRSAKDHS